MWSSTPEDILEWRPSLDAGQGIGGMVNCFRQQGLHLGRGQGSFSMPVEFFEKPRAWVAVEFVPFFGLLILLKRWQ